MKIVVTIHDADMAVHVGGGVESESVIIELPEPLPSIIQSYYKSKKWASESPNRTFYQAISLSILNEDE